VTYSKNDFGTGLRRQLEGPFDVVRIARWAFREFHNNCREMEPELQEVVLKVVAMEEGPEFEYSAEELKSLADQLTSGERTQASR